MKPEPEIVRDRFITEAGLAILGVLITTKVVPPEPQTYACDPLVRIAQQTECFLTIERSKTELIKFERPSEPFALTPGSVLVSETFAEQYRVTRYSDAEATAQVEPV